MNRRVAMCLVMLLLVIGCAPKIRTEKLGLPQALKRGPLAVILEPLDDTPRTEVLRVKNLLVDKFSEAGFGPVVTDDARITAPAAVKITLIKYEHTTPATDSAIVAVAGAAWVCPIFAPCLLVRGYYAPQFEIMADVVKYRNGKAAGRKTLTESSQSSANLVNTGDEPMRAKLEDIALHNFVVHASKFLE